VSADFSDMSHSDSNMETRISHLSDTPVETGIPSVVKDPIKPELFHRRHEARLSKSLGITQFGVNHVILEPGTYSALRHWHEGEDEFVYILSGKLVLIDENGEHELIEGSVAGFPANVPNAHHIANKSNQNASFLVIGSRMPGQDACHYPDDSLGRVQR
jgi:uncharacterized cupin superfamily protein